MNKKTINSSASKDKILASAKSLFALKGFDCTTSKEIANKADCSEGLIFKYFQDKKNLLNYILLEWFENSLKQLEQLPETNSIYDEIKSLSEWWFHIYVERHELNKIFISHRFNNQDNISNQRDIYLKQRSEIIINRLKKYQLNGELRSDIDLEQIYELCHGYAMIEIIFRDLPENEHKTKLESFVKIILDGVKAKS